MLHLYWILFLKNFVDYEKIDGRMQILNRHKLTSQLICRALYEYNFDWFLYDDNFDV